MNKSLSEDLWASLSRASSKPVADVMETWTKQMGYPVLSVTAEQVCACCLLPLNRCVRVCMNILHSISFLEEDFHQLFESGEMLLILESQ